jgi:hypothetical protein
MADGYGFLLFSAKAHGHLLSGLASPFLHFALPVFIHKSALYFHCRAFASPPRFLCIPNCTWPLAFTQHGYFTKVLHTSFAAIQKHLLLSPVFDRRNAFIARIHAAFHAVRQPLHKGHPPVYYYQTRADGCMIKIKNKRCN